MSLNDREQKWLSVALVAYVLLILCALLYDGTTEYATNHPLTELASHITHANLVN